MLFWAVDNPPPANYLLISSDRDFSNALHQLSFRRYNILLAQPPNVSQALVAAAKSVWNWEDLVAGGQPLPALPYVSSRPIGNPVSKDTANGYSADNVQTTECPSHPTVAVSLGTQKICANAKLDNRTKWKKKQLNPIQSTGVITLTPCTASEPLASQALPSYVSSQQFSNRMKNTEHLTVPTLPSTEFQDNSQVKNTCLFPQSSTPKPPSQPSEGMPFNIAPHELFQGNWPNPSSGYVADYAAPRPDFPIEQGNTFPSNHKSHWPQLLKPNDLVPPQPNSQPGNLSSTNFPNYNYGMLNYYSGPPYHPSGQFNSSVGPATLSEMGRPSSSEYSKGGNRHSPSYKVNSNKQNTSSFSEQNISWTSEPMHRPPASPLAAPPPITDKYLSQNELSNNPGRSVLTSEVQNILSALRILKDEKMIPTEASIVDCIQYGEMNIQNFDIKAALDFAIRHQHIAMHMLGVPLYVEKNTALWKWVNTMDIYAKHPKPTWDAVLKFLSSVEGQQSIMASQSRYQAAISIRKSCLNHLALGEVLQILQAITDVKKWILPHQSGWQPLSFSLPDIEKKANNHYLSVYLTNRVGNHQADGSSKC